MEPVYRGHLSHLTMMGEDHFLKMGATLERWRSARL